ncbi:MAG: Co2+/Mg2+ efflux protein ApaG [Acidobacteria bacterium]|nr:MAG: Co2+/Mg2+ efflux protein ApaG [Acidobacteriota bacterium]
MTAAKPQADFSSEAVTRGIRVRVEPEFDPERSDPARGQWFFLYTVTLSNEGDEPVQLISRHWLITDGDGRQEEVRGAGVVGEQPVLAPGESFRYTSGCPLPTDVGKMEGSYRMVTSSGEAFDVAIAPFTLCQPGLVH